MAKAKATVRWKILEFLDNFVDDATANDIGQAVVDEAKHLIESGQSPVRGVGRYEGYSDSYKRWIKNERKARIQTAVEEAKANAKRGQKGKAGTKARERAKKQEDRHGKKVRPVNLNLTGEMLDGYTFQLKDPTTIKIGVLDASAERKEIAGYHQEGTPKMPRRPLVPGDGEEWAVSIMREIRDRYGKRLQEIIRRANKKG